MRALRPRSALSRLVNCAGALLSLVLTGSLANSATPAEESRDHQVRYRVVDIGPLAWVSDEVAARINAAGEVSWWQAMPDQTLHAFTWNAGSAHDVGAPIGYLSSMSSSLNAHGDMAGWAVNGRNLVDSLATTHAFLYSRSRITDLSTLGGRDSKAMCINDSGEVVGWSKVSELSIHAFRYRRGKLEDLGTLPGGTYSAATAINAGGLIVGTAETANHLVHAVIWTNHGIVDLGTLPEGMRSRALAVNDRGDVAGFSEAEGAATHGFLFTGGHMQDLGSLGSDPVRANAINNWGQIVGGSNVTVFVRHAFLWERGNMQDLNKLIPQKAKWRLVEAYDINDAGQILCLATTADEFAARHLLLLEPLTNKGAETISERK
jgi:probable HAF family extracellular repeat protein